jgi:uncharacterized membrane protein YraQ (UPF0718 family)
MAHPRAPARTRASSAVVAVRRPASDQALFLAGSLAILTLVAGRASGVKAIPEIENFAIVFASIVVEALPFVLLGALVASIIEVFVSDDALSRVARLPLYLQVPGALVTAFSFPVCECGSVPVARRLILRGVHPAAGITFMLAAPILNPVVLASTLVAYSGRDAIAMTAGRAGLGALLALVVAVMIGKDGAATLLTIRKTDAVHAHDHRPGRGRAKALVDHLAGDLFFMGRFVVAGAALAAALQTAIPQSVFAGVLASPLISAVLMMLLAVMLSLCSEADAFVAVSFVQFPLGSQLAFLVFGPVIDLKLGLLYGATFGWRFVGWLVFVTFPFVLAGSLVLNALVLR